MMKKNTKTKNAKMATSTIYSETTSDSDSDNSYEEVLMSSMRALNNSTKRPGLKSINSAGRIKLSSDIKPTESRVEFVKHILDGNKLQSMIDFDNCSIDSDYAKLNKKTLNVKELFTSMNVRLKYIKSGTTGHTFKATSKTNDDIAFAVKVCAYPRSDEYGGMKNPKRPENAELRMLKLLSTFVLKMKTPHFILPIGTFNTSIKPFINVPKRLIDLDDEKNDSYRKFITRCENNEFEDLVSILISEWANGGDLLDYIRKNYKSISLEQWTIMIFQILYTLASIHKKYPSFRHNDMKANNILTTLIQQLFHF